MFTANSKGELPKVQGDVGLSFHPKTKNKTTTLGPELPSHRGIRFYAKTTFPDIASVNFYQARADNHGIRFAYEIGAEEIISGFQLLFWGGKCSYEKSGSNIN